MNQTLDLALVFINWNGRRDCEGALAAVRAQRPAPREVVVVDNGSSDGSLEWFLAQGDVSVVANGANLGFAKAANQGIRATSSALVMLCNLDVRLGEGFLETAAARVLSAPDVGSVGGLLLREGEGGIVDSAGHVLHRSGWVSNRGQGGPDHFRQPEEVFGVTAAAAVYRREMLTDVALDGEVFCESFFAYLEDVDLDWRARWRGWRSYLEPAARGTHRRGGSGLHQTAMIERHVLANRALLWMRNAPRSWVVGPGAASATGLILLRAGLAARRHPAALLGLADAARSSPEAIRARRLIMSRRRVPDSEMERWAEPTPWRSLVAPHLR
ncbi:MAG: glycosyltransferase family 2 protein [Candidatus Dormibacteria bacterium]